MSLESSLTWQKVTIVIAILGIVIPATSKFVWDVVFPENFLLYETTHTTRGELFQTASIHVNNAGSRAQKEIFVFLPLDAIDHENSLIEITTPKRLRLSNIYDADPDMPLSKFHQDTGLKIPVGNVEPGESVRVTLLSKSTKSYPKRLSLSDVRVESSSMKAIEADGIRYPEHNNDWHSSFVEMAPFMLAMLLFFIGIVFFVSIIFETFFDTPQQKMTRLWKQMDELQEKVDKERRYK